MTHTEALLTVEKALEHEGLIIDNNILLITTEKSKDKRIDLTLHHEMKLRVLNDLLANEKTEKLNKNDIQKLAEKHNIKLETTHIGGLILN